MKENIRFNGKDIFPPVRKSVVILYCGSMILSVILSAIPFLIYVSD